MPFNRKPQKFNASIKEVTIGCGEKAVTLGGENVFPFYTFDGEMKNAPKVGVEISDMGIPAVAGLKAYYEGCTTMAEVAKKQLKWKVLISFACVWKAEIQTEQTNLLKSW